MGGERDPREPDEPRDIGWVPGRARPGRSGAGPAGPPATPPPSGSTTPASSPVDGTGPYGPDAGTGDAGDEHVDPWMPPASGGRGRRGRWVLVVVLVLVLLPLGYLAALSSHAASSMTRVEVAGLGGGGSTTNVLVVGSDSREDLTPEERVALTTGGDFGPERTDTILLMVTRGSQVAILSFPRDLWVERCDGTSQRINTAVQVGGLGCLAETITATSGIRVDHVVEVSLGGFVEVVDAVGGVELCLENAIADRDAGIDLPAGCQTLDGADALGYVRVRKIDDDLQRIRRQQEFVAALAAEVAQPANLVLPWRAWPLVGALGGAVAVDQDLGVPQMVRLAFAAQGLATGSAIRTTVPTTPTTIDGNAVLLEAADAGAVYAIHRDGSVLDAVERPDDDADPRSDVAVVILNGAGIGGLAGATGDALVALGYPAPDLGNAERTRTTVINHPPQLQAEAERLADDVAGEIGVRPTLRARADGTRLTLVLGTDVGG